MGDEGPERPQQYSEFDDGKKSYVPSAVKEAEVASKETGLSAPSNPNLDELTKALAALPPDALARILAEVKADGGTGGVE